MSIETEIETAFKIRSILPSHQKFHWEKHSHYVAEYCPHLFDSKKFNWEEYSWAVTKHCPDKIEPELYNWKDYSLYVAMYCPDKIDPKLYNWEKKSDTLLFHHPNHKYLKHSIWNTKTINNLKEYMLLQPSVWDKYKNQIDDLLYPTKRVILLNKISKEIKLSKI